MKATSMTPPGPAPASARKTFFHPWLYNGFLAMVCSWQISIPAGARTWVEDSAARLALVGGTPWTAPLSAINRQAAEGSRAVVPAGEYHTFVVGSAAACRIDAPEGLDTEVFVVKSYPKSINGEWHLRPCYMPTHQQSEATGLWAVRFKAALPPGIHKLTISTSDQPAGTRVDYEFKVVDLKVPAADIPFGLWYDYNRFPDAYRSPRFEEMYIRDMAEHGMNTGTVYTWNAGKNDQVRQFRLMRKYGLDRFPIMLLVRCDDPAIPEIDGHRFMLFGPDEPSLERRQECADSLVVARKLGMQHVTAINPRATWAFGELFDVCIVLRNGLTPALHDYAKEVGMELWMYDCSMRGTNPQMHRYFSGLYTWAVGAKGCYRWAYVHDKKSCVLPDGQWNARMDHEYVLPGPDGPISTLGWEGVREGILDYRVIRALETKVLAGRGNPKTAEAALWLARWKHSVDPKLYRGPAGLGGHPNRDNLLDTFDPGIDLENLRAQAIEFLSD